jgi:hypothetical protein
MKIIKKQLTRIIKEELSRMLRESDLDPMKPEKPNWDDKQEVFRWHMWHAESKNLPIYERSQNFSQANSVLDALQREFESLKEFLPIAEERIKSSGLQS